jgi:cytochrome c nitrite reductase small subunit
MELKQLFKKHTLACLAGGFVIGVAACGFGSAAMSFSGSPDFCGFCHAMKHEAWTFADSSHSQLECTDCHLPHDNMAIYFIEKGRTGMVDTYHEVLRDYPAHIRLSDSGRQTVNDNCIRCHKDTMQNVHADMGVPQDTGADCLKCHSRIAHGTNHIERGIKVE